MILNRLTRFIAVGLLLSATLAVAAEPIPALAAIPSYLSAEDTANFSRQKAALDDQLRTLQSNAASFNAKSAKDQTDAEFDAVDRRRTAYINAAKAFNRAIVLAACSRAVPLQSQFASLSETIAIDRQVVANFGFEKTAAEIEAWADLPERQIEDAKEKFKKLLFDATLASVTTVAGAAGSLTSAEVDALNRLADAQGAPPLGIVAGAKDVHATFEFLERSKRVFEAADEAHKKRMFEAAIQLGGLASHNPAFGLLLTADGWAAYEVYRSATAVSTVGTLTRATEGDLILLKTRSIKLSDETKQWSTVRKQLAQLESACDSTVLTKAP